MGDETKTGGNPDEQTPEMEALNKCLNAVYLATEASIADDINRIVRAATKLQAERIEELLKKVTASVECQLAYEKDCKESEAELMANSREATRIVAKRDREITKLKQENATLRIKVEELEA